MSARSPTSPTASRRRRPCKPVSASSPLIYANISDILFYLAVEAGEHFRFISVNPAFLRATGLTEDQVVGKLVEEVIPEPSLISGSWELSKRPSGPKKRSDGKKLLNIRPAKSTARFPPSRFLMPTEIVLISLEPCMTSPSASRPKRRIHAHQPLKSHAQSHAATRQ